MPPPARSRPEWGRRDGRRGFRGVLEVDPSPVVGQDVGLPSAEASPSPLPPSLPFPAATLRRGFAHGYLRHQPVCLKMTNNATREVASRLVGFTWRCQSARRPQRAGKNHYSPRLRGGRVERVKLRLRTSGASGAIGAPPPNRPPPFFRPWLQRQTDSWKL